MGLWLDSADIEEVKTAAGLGFLAGVTTNPSIMARVKARPEDVIAQICEIVRGPVCYQVTGETVAEREAEARAFHAICPEKVVLKIPATTENIGLIARLGPGIPCALTAVYSGAQTLAACAAGARYVIPYFNRASRLLGNGAELVAEMAAVIESCQANTQILAASIKSTEEAVVATLAGADHLTLPLDLFLALGNHHLSDQAIADFAADWSRRG